jgi:hypothetical protein
MPHNNRTSLIPSAARLMTSLRDIGYDLPSAVADLVDNSIDAGARNINISVCRKGAHSFITVADDGSGMTERELDEAMRYGSRRDYRDAALGKFGLGLKTASLSQCRRLTVATRTTPKGKVRIRRWDLDQVQLTDSWDVERILPTAAPPYLAADLKGKRGTVVMWEKLDRLLEYANPDGAHALRALEAGSEAIAEHLSMVFHRFLSGENRSRRKLRITFNGERLEPWDPYARGEPATRELPKQTISFVQDGCRQRVRVRAYVLPPQVRFSTAEAHAEASGPKKWNGQQGFYIYRADRLIQSGGWNRLRTMDEHSKLARIAIDVPREAEDAFHINVAKMRVVLPETLRAPLRALAAGVVAAAQDAYRHRLQLVTDEPNGVEELDTLGTGVTISDLWPVISDVIARELADHPDLRRRVLVALANVRSVTPPRAVSAPD